MITPDARERTIRGVQRWCAGVSADQNLLRGVAERVRPVVPYDAAAWLVTDPTTMLFVDGVVEGFDQDLCLPWFHNELVEDDVNKFTDLAGRGRAARLIDSVEHPSHSRRWSNLMRPAGFDSEVRFTLDDASGCWGGVELQRSVDRPGFSRDEAGILTDLAPVIAAGLRRVALQRAALTDDRTDGPGLLSVSPDGDIVPMTAAGAGWLELLTTMPPADTALPPSLSQTALLTLHALAARAGDAPARVRARAVDGRWVTLHASPLTTGEGTVIIVEPGRPDDVSAIIAHAYGLSARERQVAERLSRGESTAVIARGLTLSPHTVRDHVKSLLAKVGVGTRAELVAALFDRHSRFHERVSAS